MWEGSKNRRCPRRYNKQTNKQTNNNNNNNNNNSSKCKLCGDKDETINHKISKCSKLVQKKWMNRHDWVGKVIHWELCKKLKFDHANKWCMLNSGCILDNETQKLLWGFEMQSDHLMLLRRPNIVTFNKKKNLLNFGLCRPGKSQSKTKRKWIDRWISRPCKRT